jgi:1-acyl-sn-glycerol-3-phosphate acyltransferase
VGLTGTDRLQPIGSRLPRLAKVTVAFGAPINVADEYDGVALGRARRDLTDRIMSAISDLTGQVEAGIYNDRPELND